MAKAVVRMTLVKKKTERPRRYKVILLGETQISTRVALQMLRSVFRKTAQEALDVLQVARRTGAGVVAVYTREVAEMKAQIAADLAARQGERVSLRVEPAE